MGGQSEVQKTAATAISPATATSQGGPFCRRSDKRLVRQVRRKQFLAIYLVKSREMEYIEQASFIEIYWSLVSLAHLINFTLFSYFKRAQHL